MKFQEFLCRLKSKEELEALNPKALDQYHQWFMEEHRDVQARVVEIIDEVSKLKEYSYEMPDFFGPDNLYFSAQCGFSAGHNGSGTHFHIYSSRLDEGDDEEDRRCDVTLFSTQDKVYRYGEWLYTLELCLQEARAANDAIKQKDLRQKREEDMRLVIERIHTV